MKVALARGAYDVARANLETANPNKVIVHCRKCSQFYSSISFPNTVLTEVNLLDGGLEVGVEFDVTPSDFLGSQKGIAYATCGGANLAGDQFWALSGRSSCSSTAGAVEPVWLTCLSRQVSNK